MDVKKKQGMAHFFLLKNTFMTNALSLPQKFIHSLMVDGKKDLAIQIFCSAGHEFLDSLNRKYGTRQHGAHALLQELHSAVGNVQPSLECRTCQVGGKSLQVPAIVSEKRGVHYAVCWIIDSARKRRKMHQCNFSHSLAQELLDAHEKTGKPRQRRDEFHKVSSGNRGYSRYRWW